MENLWHVKMPEQYRSFFLRNGFTKNDRSDRKKGTGKKTGRKQDGQEHEPCESNEKRRI